MARTENERPRSSPSPAPPADALPPIAPPRKRPWLLALAVTLFAAWLAFLIYLAIRG